MRAWKSAKLAPMQRRAVQPKGNSSLEAGRRLRCRSGLSLRGKPQFPPDGLLPAYDAPAFLRLRLCEGQGTAIRAVECV